MVADKAPEVTIELEAARGELERLKQEKEAFLQELKARESRIAECEQALADKDKELTVLKQAVVESEKKWTEVNNTLAQTIQSYKTVVVKANPEVPVELITGDTIEALNQSLEKARALVDKVRQGIEAEIARAKVPAGAPPRTALDLSALSAREKIQYGIGGKG